MGKATGGAGRTGGGGGAKTPLSAINSLPKSNNVQVAYALDNGSIKTVDMGYTTRSTGDKKLKKQDEQKQFRAGAQRVADNLSAGQSGYVRLPSGQVYIVSGSNRTARPIGSGR